MCSLLEKVKKMEFYNPEIEGAKERFLETIENEGTRTAYGYILQDAFITEKIVGKDLYNFNLGQISEVIKTKQPFRLTVARTKTSVIRQYIQWAMDNGYRDNRSVNPLEGVGEEWYNSLVDWKRKIVFSKEELEEIIEKVVNAQDRALIRMLFEGAYGVRKSELCNLKKQDIDWDNRVVILDRGGKKERVIDVSQETIQDLFEAHEQFMYQLHNGIKKSKRNSNERQLKTNDYLFRGVVIEGRETSDNLTPTVVDNRLRDIKEALKLDVLTTLIIRRSGMLHYGYELLQEYGKLDTDQYSMIGDKFGMTKITANGSTYHNKTAIATIVNMDNLKEYYDVQ